MAKQKKNPIQQKEKLVEQLKDIEKKIADFDNQRATKIGNLAKRYRLVDLSDDILEKEFKSIRDKCKKDNDLSFSSISESKKKSLLTTTD